MIKIVSLLVVLFVSVFANAQTDSTGVSQRFNSEQFLFTLKNDVLTDTLICQELITQFSEQISSVKTSEKSTELLVSVCEFYIHLKDYSDANIYYQHAQETAVKFSTPDLNVRLLLIKSDLLAVSRNYGDAIVSYFDALELAEEFKLVDLQAAISLRLADFFMDSESNLLAEKYVNLAYQLLSKKDAASKVLLSESYLKLALLAEMDFQESEDKDKLLLADAHLRASKEIILAINRKDLESQYYSLLAIVQNDMMQTDLALASGLKALKFAEQVQDNRCQLFANMAMGEIFVKTANYEAAQQYLAESSLLSAYKIVLPLQKRVAILAINLLEKQELYREALFQQKKLIRLTQSLNVERFNKETAYEIYFGKDKDVVRQIGSNTSLLLVLGVIIALLLLAAWRVFVLDRLSKKNKDVLLQRKIYTKQLSNELTQYKKESMEFQTGLRRAEDRFEALQENYSLITKLSDDIIIRVDSQSCIRYISPNISKYMQYEDIDLLDSPIDRSSHYLLQELCRLVWRPIVIENTEIQSNYVIQLVSKMGVEYSFRVLADVNRSETGEVSEIIMCLKEINELLAHRDELNKYNVVLDQSPASIVITNKDAEIEYVNPKFTELTGFSLDDVLGKNPRILKPAYRKSSDYAQMWKTISAGMNWQGEFENVKKNGEIYWELTSIASIKNVKGEITHYIAIKEDITAHKDLLKVIQESEQLYSSVLQTSPDGIAIINLDGQISFASSKLLEMFAIKKSNEIIGSKITNWVEKAYHTKIKEHISQALENRPLENKEFILKRRGGDCFWAEVSTSVLRDSGGKPIGLVSVQRDISGRKQIEEELEANRLLIRKIINTMPAFVSYIDANGYFSISNSRFEDIFGIKLARPLKGAHFTQIMPLFMLAKHQELMRICMETGAIQHFEELLPTGQHANQSIYGLYSPFYTNNVIEGIVLVVLDITNQKNTEKQLAASEQKLRESNELKDKMFSIIGHDLRGPIGNLANTLDILAEEDGFFDQNSRKRMIFLLRQSAGAALNLLENLLTWALSQRSNLSYFPSNVQINSLVRENYALLKTVANKKEIELLSHVPDDVFAYIDENLITTVLRNLISNAIKFTNPGGWVEVNASIRNLMVEVIVRDNGVGISEENLFQILHKKSHLTTYGTSNEKGSGLGLMLCQELIAKNNGQLQIISKQGEGSSFIISLPCVQS